MSADEPDSAGTEAESEPADETPNAASPRSQRRIRDKVKRAEEETKQFWRAVLSGEIGRREVWRLLTERCHAFNDEFPAGPAGFPDASARDFLRGQQSLGLGLYQDLMVIDGEAMLLLHRENDPRFAPPKRRG